MKYFISLFNYTVSLFFLKLDEIFRLSNGNEADISEEDDEENGENNTKLLKKAIAARRAERKKPTSNLSFLMFFTFIEYYLVL